MEDTPITPGPGGQRSRPRLDRPPSDRFVDAEAAPETIDARPPFARGIAAAVAAAILGGAAISIAGGLLTVTAGLLVVAAVVGWVVATALALGAGPATPATPSTRARRRWIAALLALAGVALGQLGLWLIARQEGGTLAPIEYLGEVFGVLVPAELVIAALVAWWRAR